MMRIGELAKRAGVSTSLLRYYEDQGLLTPGSRTEAGYRVYKLDALGRIGFIQRAKALGLSLEEIRRLLQEPSDSATELARLRHAIAHKVADVQRRIAELEALRHELEALHARLGDGVGICGHIGDCECWLPTGEEVKQMTVQVHELVLLRDDPARSILQGIPVAGQAQQRAGTAVALAECSCCGCACPSDGDSCTCCGCESL